MSTDADEPPIENPELVAAIAAYAGDPCERNRAAISRALRRATYLVPIVVDEKTIGPGDALLAPGSGFQTLVCADPETKAELLPIFTDGAELAAFSQQSVATLVLELAEVHELIAGSSGYAGAVVNPAGTAIPMSRRMIAALCSSEGGA
jgi:hypothetical protein